MPTRLNNLKLKPHRVLMEIKNEEDARTFIQSWLKLPDGARAKEIALAVERLELSGMYYEMKGNSRGVSRTEKCIAILREHMPTRDP